jgi:hypothetical protein
VLHVDLEVVTTFAGIPLQLISIFSELAHNLNEYLPVDICISFLCLQDEHLKLVLRVSHVYNAHVLITLAHLLVLVEALIGIEYLLSFKTHIVGGTFNFEI